MQGISVGKMRKLEENAIKKGVTVLELMEKAGKECAKNIESKYGTGKTIVIFCGPGNNGGDGYSIARNLIRENVVFIVKTMDPRTEEAKLQYDHAIEEGADEIGSVIIGDFDVVIDALLGIGAKGELRGEIRKACRRINSLSGTKISIDIPTGMDADTGECDEDAVTPDVTICIQAPKIGEIKAGKEKTGELVAVDIGLG